MKEKKKGEIMRKYVSVVLVLMLVLGTMFGLTACGGQGAADDGPLRVAMSPDFPPMEFVDSSKSGQDQYVGFDVLLAQYLADGMGRELEIVPLSFDACQTAVEQGTVDMSISGYADMPERHERFNVSDGYHHQFTVDAENKMLVRVENEGLYTTPESYAGLKVGAQMNSWQASLCKDCFGDTVQLLEFENIADGVNALIAGEIDAMAVATLNGKAYISSNGELAWGGLDLHNETDGGQYLILMQKGNDALTAKVNAILKDASAYYKDWYDICGQISGLSSAKIVTYDDQGNVVESSEIE